MSREKNQEFWGKAPALASSMLLTQISKSKAASFHAVEPLTKQALPSFISSKVPKLLASISSKLPNHKQLYGKLERGIEELNKRPELEEKLRKMLSYRLLDKRNLGNNMRVGQMIGATGGSLLGGTSGAVTGALTGLPGGDQELSWGDRLAGAAAGGLTGVLGGGAAGAGVGRMGGKHLPRLAQKGIGRVLTNVMDPVSYNDKVHLEALAQYSPKEIIKAIVKDQPLGELRQPTGLPHMREGWMTDPARSAMFRDYFGLPRRKGTVSVFKRVGKDEAGGRIVEHNPKSLAAQKELDSVENAVVSSVSARGQGAKHMQKDKPTLVNAGAMGNFHVKPDGSWEDVWDFALNPGEKINSPEKLLRALVSPFGTPTTIRGKTLNQGEAIGRVRGMARSALHESFGPYYR